MISTFAALSIFCRNLCMNLNFGPVRITSVVRSVVSLCFNFGIDGWQVKLGSKTRVESWKFTFKPVIFRTLMYSRVIVQSKDASLHRIPCQLSQIAYRAIVFVSVTFSQILVVLFLHLLRHQGLLCLYFFLVLCFWNKVKCQVF